MEISGNVAILLATYNGEKYLDEQICSILAQTYSDFRVIVRDDCSSDRTPEILARWAALQPTKIRVVSDDRGNLKSIGSFSRLMEVCDSPYFAFCDQDDVWLPTKIELMISKVQKLENEFGKTMPVLVHSDLTIVDGTLREISSSLFHHWQINFDKDRRLDHLIINNIVTGCALMGNRALLELARPIPAGVRVHDWWLALIAVSCGVLRTMPESTILYRQHDENQIGAGHRKGHILWDARYILRQPRKLKARLERALAICQSQAQILLRVAGGKMSRRDREFLRAFCVPICSAEMTSLPWSQRSMLLARFLIVYVRALPIALRWCF